jgi:MFS family permease
VCSKNTTRQHCHQRLRRRRRNRRHHPQRAHVPHDAYIIHIPNPLSPSSTLLRARLTHDHSRKPRHVILRDRSLATHCQGVLCAIGSGLLFSPTTLYLDEWFIARKGLAYGTIWVGKSAAGVVFPFVMSSLLSRYGSRTTLQAWAVTLAILTAPLLFFLQPRIPISNTRTQRPLSWRFLKHSTFWMMQLGNVIQSFGYLYPSTHLASYAHSLGLPEVTGAVLIAVFALASVPGSFILGLLGDRFKPTTVILISSLGSTIAVF